MSREGAGRWEEQCWPPGDVCSEPGLTHFRSTCGLGSQLGNRFGPLRKTNVYLVCQEPDDCLIIFWLELFHSSHSLLHT